MDQDQMTEHGKKAALQTVIGKTVKAVCIGNLTDHVEITFTDGSTLDIYPLSDSRLQPVLNITAHEKPAYSHS